MLREQPASDHRRKMTGAHDYEEQIARNRVAEVPQSHRHNRRILLISRNFPPLVGGMERLNQHVFLELAHAYEVHLVGPGGAAAHIDCPDRVRSCPAAPISRFITCATVQGIRIGRCVSPGLVIAGSGVNAPPAWASAKASGARWMVYLHGLDLVVKNAIYQRLFLPIIRRADAWLVNSRATAQMATATGLDKRRLHILHPGVTIPRALPSNGEVSAWRQRHGLDDRPVLLSVGRLSKRKGLKEFILHALPAVIAAHPDALLVVVGEEPNAALKSATVGVAALQEAARTRGIIDGLRIMGHLSDQDLTLAYRAASVFVFPVLDVPGDVEGFGMVAIEAAAHGLPTVGFAVGGVPDAVMPERSGTLFTPGDYPGMAKRIVDHLRFGPSAPMGESCRRFAQGFAWDRFGANLRQVTEEYLVSNSP